MSMSILNQRIVQYASQKHALMSQICAIFNHDGLCSALLHWCMWVISWLIIAF